MNPYETAEYQRFVAEMAKYCTCEYDSPCDGVLAGGPCDRKTRADYSEPFGDDPTEKQDDDDMRL